MIELCFDQSTQGALRCAQHCGGGGRKAFGVIFGRAEADGSGENVESTIVIGYDNGKKPTKREIRQIQRDFQRKQEALAREAIPLGGNAGDAGPVPGPGHGGYPGAPGRGPADLSGGVVHGE